MARVRLPNVLRRYAGGQAWIVVPGATVGEILDHLAADYPAVAHHVRDEAGDLRRYVNVFVRDEEIRAQAYLATAVGPDEEVLVIPSIAGGAT